MNTGRAPARNRVTPLGEIVAIDARGAWTGNRGILHRDREIVRDFATKTWLTCVLEFKDRRQPQWQAGRYTSLFFLDEAVALAAGHRPCAECRRTDYNAYRTAWTAEQGGALPLAKELDERLHRERLRPGTHDRQLHQLDWRGLPDGVFALVDDRAAIVVGDHLGFWGEDGYAERAPRPRRGIASVITPPASVAVLSAGYPVQIDQSAR